MWANSKSRDESRSLHRMQCRRRCSSFSCRESQFSKTGVLASSYPTTAKRLPTPSRLSTHSHGIPSLKTRIANHVCLQGPQPITTTPARSTTLTPTAFKRRCFQKELAVPIHRSRSCTVMRHQRQNIENPMIEISELESCGKQECASVATALAGSGRGSVVAGQSGTKSTASA
jgi:hypothetical protein